MKAIVKFCIILLCVIASLSTSKAQINIADSTQHIQTIRDLLLPYKGKPVFVDLWASWCTPCKEEFRFSKTLYAQLQKRKIVMLYVSID